MFRGMLACCLLAISVSAHGEDANALAAVKKELAEKKAILLDVREQGEWNAGHLVLAKLVPLSLLNAGKGSDGLPKDKIIYCHCRSGIRSQRAAEILKKKGYDARSLSQGFQELVEAGFEKAK
ncbi:MAG: rhodanese-like domain-containing protein [Gemmataceae bacterium]